MRKLPDISLLPCPPEYAHLVAHGWDSVQEAYALRPTPRFVSFLESAQNKAREVNESDGIVVVDIAGYPFKVSAHGTRRYRWKFENDDFIVFVGTPTLDWAVSVRYLSAGLWEHSWEALQERVLEILRPNTIQRAHDFIRVTRADYCFDFFSPSLESELQNIRAVYIAAHHWVKKRTRLELVGNSEHDQTFTLGSKGGLEIQLYDKTREIVEKSHKSWMYDLWRRGLHDSSPWPGQPHSVWRLEVRMFKDFLKERNCRQPHQVRIERGRLVAEALCSRRWVVQKSDDERRRRWPMHPIWSEAVRQCDASDLLPLGRKVTGNRHALIGKAVGQLSGVLRSATVLDFGDYNDAHAKALLKRAYKQISSDPRHKKKTKAAKDRYSDVDEAK